MKRFTSDQRERHAAIKDRLTEGKSNLEAAIAEFNQQLAAIYIPVQHAVEELQGEINDANALLDEVRTDAQAHYDEKSEKWQESEKGSDYQDWITELEQTLDDVELDAPEDLSDPDFDAIDTFENIRLGVDD